MIISQARQGRGSCGRKFAAPLSHKIIRVKRDTAKGWWPLRSVKGVESTHGSQLSDHAHKEPINSAVSESLLGSVHPANEVLGRDERY